MLKCLHASLLVTSNPCHKAHVASRQKQMELRMMTLLIPIVTRLKMKLCEEPQLNVWESSQEGDKGNDNQRWGNYTQAPPVDVEDTPQLDSLSV